MATVKRRRARSRARSRVELVIVLRPDELAELVRRARGVPLARYVLGVLTPPDRPDDRQLTIPGA